MNPCPVCHRQGVLLLAAASGFWERHVLSHLGIQPYRCRACGNRILRRQGAMRPADAGQGAESTLRQRPRSTDADVPNPSTEERFLTSREAPHFDELIRQLKETETRRGLAEDGVSTQDTHDR